MENVTTIKKARSAKNKKIENTHSSEGFTPCSQDMTICGDCDRSRAKNTCPRLKEWLAKHKK